MKFKIINKDKAFTLVELLSVVLILSIILLISVPSIFNIINNRKVKDYELLIASIEDGAKLYTNENKEEIEEWLLENDFYSLTIKDLNYAGLVKENLINPLTSNPIPHTKEIFIFHDEDDILIYCFEDQECAENLNY